MKKPQIKQFKLSTGEEIICEVVQWDDADSAAIIFRAGMQLVENNNWGELNDRFYKCLSFGTGGLRGRTIGRIITSSEQGSGGPNGRPEHPCIGSNAMNNYNLNRATRGLIYYLQELVFQQRAIFQNMFLLRTFI